MMQLLYIDIETTGLIKYTNGIINLAYIIEDINGKKLAEGSIHMNTFAYKSKANKKALEINGYTIEEIKDFQSPKDAIEEFIDVLRDYYNGEKYKVVAYNAEFDTGFLQEWFNALMPDTYWRFLDYKHLDPFALVKIYQQLGMIDTGKSQRLETVAEYFDIEHNAHDAVSDIRATRELWKILTNDNYLVHKDNKHDKAD
jgi:DNA polymerase-3 subunit epsilon